MLRDYHKNDGKPRCTLKVDLMKAYDSVNWDYVLHCLNCFGFPAEFISWVRACVTSPKFSVALNGTLEGYFDGKKGLRQGDPLSPYLFVIAMEILASLLKECAKENKGFKYHYRCSNVKLTHLCFADDLLIFSEGKLDSVAAIKQVLHEFSELSGLKTNPTKSTLFCSGIASVEKGRIVDCLQMEEGKLPVLYLGVPLISLRLSTSDCSSLLDKITSRIDSWLSHNLSFAGPLQLVTSVLYSIYRYIGQVSSFYRKISLEFETESFPMER